MRKIAILIVFLLLATFPQVSPNIWIKTYLPSTPIQGGTYFNGTVYIVGPSMNGMLLIALHDNGSPEWIVEYRAGDYTLVPKNGHSAQREHFHRCKDGGHEVPHDAHPPKRECYMGKRSFIQIQDKSHEDTRC